MERGSGLDVWSGADAKSRFWLAYLRGWEHPAKVRLFHACARRFFPDGLLVRNSRGTRLKARPQDYIGWAICRTGCWEPETLALAARLLGDGGLFVDVGANSGIFSCSLGVLEGVRCCALEPFAANFEMLRENLSLNPVIDGWAFNLAAGAGTGFVVVEQPRTGNSGTVRIGSGGPLEEIPCLTSTRPLRELLEFIGSARPVLMKIDVEGYELTVLEGVDWSPGTRPKNLIIEFTEMQRALVDFLREKGYVGRTVTGDPLSLDEAVPEENAWFAAES